MPHFDRRRLLQATCGLGLGALTPLTAFAERKPEVIIAATPPMGWCSGRAFPEGLNEAQALETAQIMVDKLLTHGYDLLVLDGPWGGLDNLDGYGRWLPDPARFPSSLNGAGFKPLGTRLHDAFLRFGLSLPRGIPKAAVERNLPILGQTVRARDIAIMQNPGAATYGIDMKKSGAQAYYNSVFKLLAEWGVDFVRIEDMTGHYSEHYLEVEAILTAIEASGRPMTLSLSSGATDLRWAEHAEQHAHMWRISDDMSDDWTALKAQFKRLKDWTPYRGPGRWPDPDSLPLGQVSGTGGTRQKTRLTPDEQTTLMTLMAITRSPLFMGGDLHGMDAATLELLTNAEVLRVNQKSENNRASYMKNEGDAYHYWTAKPQDGKGLYVALFNLADQERFRYINLWEVGLDGKKSVRDLWARTELSQVKQRFGITLPPHGSGLFLIS